VKKPTKLGSQSPAHRESCADPILSPDTTQLDADKDDYCRDEDCPGKTCLEEAEELARSTDGPESGDHRRERRGAVGTLSEDLAQSTGAAETGHRGRRGAVGTLSGRSPYFEQAEDLAQSTDAAESGHRGRRGAVGTLSGRSPYFEEAEDLPQSTDSAQSGGPRRLRRGTYVGAALSGRSEMSESSGKSSPAAATGNVLLILLLLLLRLVLWFKNHKGQHEIPFLTSGWLAGVAVRSRTHRSRVRVPPGPLSSKKLKQVIYTCGAQANSAFHPSGVGK